MTKLFVKPLSSNKCWRGRRFKTDEYKDYEKLLLMLLPKDVTVPKGDLVIRFEFGFSSRASDWDNPVKPLQDILQKKYGFDDKRIFDATVRKRIVPKGQEYFKFSIEEFRGEDL